jgi:hypothetical protein
MSDEMSLGRPTIQLGQGLSLHLQLLCEYFLKNLGIAPCPKRDSQRLVSAWSIFKWIFESES